MKQLMTWAVNSFRQPGVVCPTPVAGESSSCTLQPVVGLASSNDAPLVNFIDLFFDPFSEQADDDRSNLINLRRHRGSETNSNSPVWIRKQNGSLNTHTDKPVHSSTQSCTVDPTHSSAPPRSRSRPPGVRSSMVESHSEPSLCIPCIAAKHYYLCLPPDIRTLIGPRVLKCIESGLLQVNPRNCKDCRRHVYAVGIDLFNRNPLRGLAFLERYKFLNVSCPEEVARFIASTPGLCRSRIGTFLGLPPSKNVDPTKVMHCLLQGLDFSNLEVDEALRLAVRHFGMPIESQEIDRYLQCLAECYYISRWPPLREGGVKINVAPVDMNQLLLLFYSVLLLQTSFHNENAAKSTMGKQTINMFLKNTHSFLFPNPSSDPQTEVNPNRRSSSTQDLHSDTASLEKLAARKEAFSNAKLTAIFQRIKAVPIVTGVDHTSLVQRISRALVVPPVHSECKHKQCGCCGLCESFLGLVEPHRRLVCYCTMVQFVRQHGRPNKVGVPRHVFLFNDLILLTKHAHSKRGESKRNLTGRQQDRLRDAIVCLLRGATETNESKQLDRLLAFYLHPPIDLLIQTPSQHESRRRNQRSEEYTTPNHRARPVSLERPANSCSLKSDVKVRSRSTCQRTIPSRLIGLRCVSLVGCAVKLFQTLGL
ncbi:unnamed protein product [Calicophoron daubneyi]|uniref:SEC7 domain-containing protein n=1 Tax=Calicophoron daubneyi TaxID=300641 RepID=A0AAV2TNQ7_CALDB